MSTPSIFSDSHAARVQHNYSFLNSIFASSQLVSGSSSSSSWSPAVRHADTPRKGDLPNTFHARNSFILIVLNHTFDSLFPFLYAHAAFIVTADGAANRIQSWQNKTRQLSSAHNNSTSTEKRVQDSVPSYGSTLDTSSSSSLPISICMNRLPDLLVGDFDSVSKDTLQLYSNSKVELAKDSDEETTDLEKCIEELRKRLEKSATSSDNHLKGKLFENDRHDSSSGSQRIMLPIIVYPAFGGRLDHEIRHLQVIHKHAKRKLLDFSARIILLNEENICEAIEPGLTHSFICSRFQPINSTCGYFPMEGPAKVTTKGFRYDVTDCIISFSGLISTSNITASTELELKSDSPLVFTCTFQGQNAVQNACEASTVTVSSVQSSL